LVLLTLLMLMYIPLRSFLFPKKVEGVLEECLPGSHGRRDASIAIRVAGKTHKVRYNGEAVRVLESAMGQSVRVTVGALGTILCIESSTKSS
jgi:hypothetical protein